MKENQYLLITLPDSLAELPVKILRGANCRELVLCVDSPDSAETCSSAAEVKKYAFIWRQSDYLKVSTDEIVWVEASGSYSVIHLTEKRDLTVSFNLAVIRKELPESDFVQIHRSRIVNLKHVKLLIGNSLKVADNLLTIGRGYREAFLGRVIFLGVRRLGKLLDAGGK